MKKIAGGVLTLVLASLAWKAKDAQVVQDFLHPQRATRPTIEFDNDPKLAIAARKRVFARAAREKLAIAGMHLPFPGLGHIRQAKEGYAWVPAEFSPLPASK